MNLTLFLTLASIHIAVVMTPGANFLRVTQNALAYSRRTGLLTAIGVATGSGLYVLAGMIGFAAVVSQSPIVYDLIRMVGAAYFAYMGSQLLMRQLRSAEVDAAASISDLSHREAYRAGLLTAIANPAAALYFLSLFTTVIPLSSVLTDKIFAGLLLVTITLTWYAFIVTTFSNRRVRSFYHHVERWTNRAFGVLWLLFFPSHQL